MGSHAEANTYLNDLNLTVKPLAVAAHEAFVAEGCSSYVKTIYIGYDIGGEMVAALRIAVAISSVLLVLRR